jgi:hypothetical protein
MRNWINLINEEQGGSRIDAALKAVATYIEHNTPPKDWYAISEMLREFGYQEPINQNEFFRAIFHEPTDLDRSQHATIGDFYAELEREVRFDLNRKQSFTTSLEKAVDFIHGTYHIQWYKIDWPTQNSNKPLDDHGKHSVAVVYQISVPSSSILWSIRGLRAFLKSIPSTGPGWDALRDILNDEWTGYGSSDEVFIDTSNGAHIVSLTLYDSDEYGEVD